MRKKGNDRKENMKWEETESEKSRKQSLLEKFRNTGGGKSGALSYLTKDQNNAQWAHRKTAYKQQT